jgi:hypothetical protein
VILPLFLLTVAALDVHMAEEYLTKFGPAMSRLFDISWTEQSFLLIFAFVGPCCVFRGKSSTCSNRSRPLIPIQVDQ